MSVGCTPDQPCADTRALGKMPGRGRPLSQIRELSGQLSGIAPGVHPTGHLLSLSGPQRSVLGLVGAQATAPLQVPCPQVLSPLGSYVTLV